MHTQKPVRFTPNLIVNDKYELSSRIKSLNIVTINHIPTSLLEKVLIHETSAVICYCMLAPSPTPLTKLFYQSNITDPFLSFHISDCSTVLS